MRLLPLFAMSGLLLGCGPEPAGTISSDVEAVPADSSASSAVEETSEAAEAPASVEAPGPVEAVEDDGTVAVGRAAPGFEVVDENEDRHTLASLHDGRYLVLGFSRAHW
ncbi:MAG: hypothetical protein AAGA29_09595 [Planctomycetota bacterium]